MTGYVETSVYEVEKNGWKLLAERDDSADYEVDQHWIYDTGDEIKYVVATGCSCWGGEANVYTFPNLKALSTFMLDEGNQTYYMTDRGTHEMLAEAYKNFSA